MRTTESKLLSETSMLSDRVRVRETPPGHPRLGNPPPSVVARGNRPKPGRRRAVWDPYGGSPGDSTVDSRSGAPVRFPDEEGWTQDFQSWTWVRAARRSLESEPGGIKLGVSPGGKGRGLSTGVCAVGT